MNGEEAKAEIELAKLVARDIADALNIELDDRQHRIIVSIVLRVRRESRVDALASLNSQLAELRTNVAAITRFIAGGKP